MTEYLSNRAKLRMRRQMVQYAIMLRLDAQAYARTRSTQEQTPVAVGECGGCRRRGRWGKSDVAAVSMFCSSLCQWGEFSKEEWEVFDSHFEESRARNAAQAKAEMAGWVAEDQDDREREEEERLGVLSPSVMAEEEAASTGDVQALLSAEGPAYDDDESSVSEYDERIAYDLADYQVLLFNADDQHPDERVRI